MIDLAEQCCEHLGRYDGGIEVLILHLGNLPCDEDALRNETLASSIVNKQLNDRSCKHVKR